MAKILVEIVGDAKKFKSELGSAGRDAESFGSKSSKAMKGLGLAAGGLALGGVALLGKGLMDGVKTAIEHQNALAQTEAVIKSTGGGAKVTADHILSLSDHIEKMSGVDDLAVQAGENMLLTFRNIKNGVGESNKIFDQATLATTDLSVAMGKDLQSSSILVGKALNDPINGLTALTRVGVTFDEQQKEAIKTMVKSGDTMGAQKVILGELTKEFGGSAEAAGGTFAGQVKILQAHLEDLEQEIGEKVLPILTRLVDWAIKNWPEFQRHAEVAMQRITEAWDTQLHPAIIEMQGAFNNILHVTERNWSGENGIGSIVAASLQQTTGVIKAFTGVLRGDWGDAWDGARQAVTANMRIINGILTLEIKALERLGSDLGGALVDGFSSGLSGLGAALASGIKGPINAVIDAWNSLSFDVPGFDPPGPGPKFGGAHIGVPHVPHLAAGGIVTSATLAMIGESGPEAVVPLSGGGLGGTTVNVTVEGWVGNDQDIAEKIRNVLIRTGRTTSGGAFGGFA